MNTLHFSGPQQRLVESMLAAMRPLGYDDELIARDYGYRDRFARKRPERRIGAALFGRTPVSYETALIGIAEANGTRGVTLVNEHRSLGAPVMLEVGDDTIGIWTVSRREESPRLEHRVDEAGFQRWVAANQSALRPIEFLRIKDGLGPEPTFFQFSLFAGLIPELEEEISKSLDPILRGAFRDGMEAYEQTTGDQASEPELFRVAFWMLTGKVFADRGHDEFADLKAPSSPEAVLNRVAKHYGQDVSDLLNHEAREAIYDRVWRRMDFRNLSVEVLSQIWSKTLVTKKTRKRLGIHRTRRSIVRYLIDRIPFEDFDTEERRVLEPCSGSATFLVAALERMRETSPEMPDSAVRHAYFQRMLTGFEWDPFGVEIGSLCLALADYPNANGWDIRHRDVFRSTEFEAACRDARIILCNPPFEDFDDREYEEAGARTKHRPAELLSRILEHLHPKGVLGFVLPQSFLDHRGYASTRRRIAERYHNIELLALPGKGWEHADKETVLLIAKNPVAHAKATVSFGRVKEQSWRDFERSHAVDFRAVEEKTPEDADASFRLLELKEVWEYLDYCQRLREVAESHKGVEWTLDQEENRDFLVRSRPVEGHDFRLGIPPQASPFLAFERPPVAYLNFDEEHRRRPESFKRRWDQPKVILRRGRKSRPGPWKLAAFADLEGLACYESFIAVWPNDGGMILPLAAVLNGPLANAFLADRETGPHIVKKSLLDIPVPSFSKRQKDELERLVQTYTQTLGAESNGLLIREQVDRQADSLLRQIDAIVLEAYGLPPRLERMLLDYFNGFNSRPVPYRFADYFPREFKPFFALKDWLTGRHAHATIERFRSEPLDLPAHIRQALELADDLGDKSEA